MSELNWKDFLNLGGTGVLAFVMWQFAKQFLISFTDQVKARIESLERRTNECEADRIRLNEKVAEILTRNHSIDAMRHAKEIDP